MSAELPKMPEPVAFALKEALNSLIAGRRHCIHLYRNRVDEEDEPLYTAADLELAKQEATRQAMQLAENACARIESSEWAQYKGRAVNQVAEKAANPYIAGKSDGASDCVDAIRAITHESEKRHG